MMIMESTCRALYPKSAGSRGTLASSQREFHASPPRHSCIANIFVAFDTRQGQVNVSQRRAIGIFVLGLLHQCFRSAAKAVAVDFVLGGFEDPEFDRLADEHQFFAASRDLVKVIERNPLEHF